MYYYYCFFLRVHCLPRRRMRLPIYLNRQLIITCIYQIHNMYLYIHVGINHTAGRYYCYYRVYRACALLYRRSSLNFRRLINFRKCCCRGRPTQIFFIFFLHITYNTHTRLFFCRFRFWPPVSVVHNTVSTAAYDHSDALLFLQLSSFRFHRRGRRILSRVRCVTVTKTCARLRLYILNSSRHHGRTGRLRETSEIRT